MTTSEQVIQLLRDGEIIVTRDGPESYGMILTNLVDFGAGYILMHGSWFASDWGNHGDEIHIRDNDLVFKHDGNLSTDWELSYLKLRHWKRGTGWDTGPHFEAFEKIAETKKRVEYDFEAAQKIVSQKQLL